MQFEKDRVAVVWFASLESGNDGCIARNYCNALQNAGIPVTIIDVHTRQMHLSSTRFKVRADKGEACQISPKTLATSALVVVQGDPRGLAQLTLQGSYRTAAFVSFPNPEPPLDWIEPLREFDEIWTSTDYCRERLEAAGFPGRNLYVFPNCFGCEERVASKFHFAADARKTFKILADVPVFNRREISIAVQAYFNAFTASDDVTLVLRTDDPERTAEQIEREVIGMTLPELERREDRPDFEVANLHITCEELPRLYNSFDILLNTSRGERALQSSIESMACAVPVVGVQWGALQDVLSERNSFLVAVDRNARDGSDEARRSDLCAGLSLKLREAFERNDERIEKGRNARRDVNERHGDTLVGSLFQARFSAYRPHDFRDDKQPIVRIEDHDAGRRGSTSRPEANDSQFINVKQSICNPKYETHERLLEECLNRLIMTSDVPIWNVREKQLAIREFYRFMDSVGEGGIHLPAPIRSALHELSHAPSMIGKYKNYRRAVALAREARNWFYRFRSNRPSATETVTKRQPVPAPPAAPAAPPGLEALPRYDASTNLRNWVSARRRLFEDAIDPINPPLREMRRLAALKNRFIGERIFLVGNGPSLTAELLNRLRGEFTFAVHRINLAFDRTAWRPTFYTSLDWALTVEHYGEIDRIREQGTTCFYPSRFHGLLDQGGSAFWYPTTRPGSKLRERFETDALRGVREGTSALYVACQLAWFLGFREFLLVGVDCRYGNSDLGSCDGASVFRRIDEISLTSPTSSGAAAGHHFHPNYIREGSEWSMPDPVDQKREWALVRNFVEYNGGSIFNASEGGDLDVLERKHIDELVSPCRTATAIGGDSSNPSGKRLDDP